MTREEKRVYDKEYRLRPDVLARAKMRRKERPPRKTRTYTLQQKQKWLLKKRYGITPEERGTMEASQSGLCGICKKQARLVVDHDHVTGKVRGLLCFSCNTAIGLLGDGTLFPAAAAWVSFNDPLCKQPHKSPNEWTGPEHACAGPGCCAPDHATGAGSGGTVPQGASNTPSGHGIMPRKHAGEFWIW